MSKLKIFIAAFVAVVMVSSLCSTVLAAEMVSELYTKGYELQKQGKLAEALALYNRCLELEPDNFKALLAVGTVCYALRDYGRASRQYETILIFYPDNLKARLYLAYCRIHLGAFEEAKNALEMIVAERPDDVPALIALGLAEYLMGNHFTGVDFLKKAMALNPANKSLTDVVARLETAGREQLKAEDQEKRFQLMSDLNNAIAEASVAAMIAAAGEQASNLPGSLSPAEKMALIELGGYSDDSPGRSVIPLPFPDPPLTPPGRGSE